MAHFIELFSSSKGQGPFWTEAVLLILLTLLAAAVLGTLINFGCRHRFHRQHNFCFLPAGFSLIFASAVLETIQVLQHVHDSDLAGRVFYLPALVLTLCGLLLIFLGVYNWLPAVRTLLREWQASREGYCRLESVVNAAAEPLLLIGLDHRVTPLNAAAQRLFNGRADDTESFCYQLFHAKEAPCGPDEECPLRQVRATGKGVTLLHRHKRSEEGGEQFYEVTAGPLLDAQGRLQGVVEIPRDITVLRRLEAQLAESERRLEFLTNHDPLTELANRRLFNLQLENALRLARERGGQMALLFLDLDRFKTINESLGHHVGDEVLREVAGILKYYARPTDTVARLGGDEFLIILQDFPAVAFVEAFARKVLSLLSQPLTVKGYQLNVSSSIGVSLFPSHTRDVDQLMQFADMAMYQAKDQGKNTYCFYSPEMNSRAHERLKMETGLHRALEQERLVLSYQKQVDLASGRLVGVEALLRWQHPEKGLVAPDRFIPLAEETGIIIEFGAWVLQTACAQAQAWRKQGLPDVPMAVNLSVKQFRHGELVERIRQVLQETGFPAELLELEITESTLMDDVDAILPIMHQLTDLGVKLAIDDFGTGYSSLSYLKRLPLSKLKIDQSFVRDIGVDSNDTAIVSSIIALGQSMNLKVMAEGVETPEQVAFLLQNGCREGQGFLFSPPLSARDLLRALAEETSVAKIAPPSKSSPTAAAGP